MAWDNPSRGAPHHLKQATLKHDNHTCRHCGTTNGPLEVDHIDNTRGPNYNNPNNLQTLCKPCHNKKTQQEAQKARNAWKRPPENHPGLI